MKKITCLIASVLFCLFGCVSTSNGGNKGASKKDIEKFLDNHSFTALSKIDEKKLPKYVLAIIGDATVVKRAEVDLGQLLQDEIRRSGRVIITDRNNIDEIIKEQKLALQGLTEESSIEIGQMLGADFLILSSIISSSQQKVDKVVYDLVEIKVTAQVKLINVITSEVFLSINGEGEASAKLVTDSTGELITGAIDYNNLYVDATKDAIKSIIPQFLKSFPIIGFVLNITNDNFQVDIGSDMGVTEKSKIAFIRRGEPIYHPITEKLISYNIKYLGYGVVTNSQSQTCNVKIVEKYDTITTADIAVLVEN